jgi:hypothetical protein
MRITTLALLGLLTFGLAACDTNDGTAEQTGEKIDEMVTDTENKVEDLCENMKKEMNTEDQDC